MQKVFKMPGVQALVSNRRRKIYAEEHFRELTSGSGVLVPRYLSPPILPYFEFLVEEMGKAIREGSIRRRQEIFLATPKHVLGLPLNRRVFLVQTEQTHFDSTQIENMNSRDLFNFDPALAEVVEGVRIHGPIEAYLRADKIIEYSRANLHNVLESRLAHLYEGKAEYVAPLIPNQPANTSPRQIRHVTTMFSNPLLGRRNTLIESLHKAGISSINISGQFNYDQAFKNTSVLLNVSQVPYFQTPEELRILPALLQRVIVICEDLQQLRHLDYRDLIEVAHFNEMARVAKNTLSNYAEKWFSIFGSASGEESPLERKVKGLREANQFAMNRMLS